MNIGIVGLRGSWSTQMLHEHLKRKGAGGDIYEASELASGSGIDFEGFDGIILKKLGTEYAPGLLDLLEESERGGVSFFSKPSSIRQILSRHDCTTHLLEHGIPMPPTLFAQTVEEALAWSLPRMPVIVKPTFGSKARGMLLLHDAACLEDDLRVVFGRGEGAVYLQQKLDLEGSDYALAFLGDDYVGAYARVADGATWHTAVSESGTYQQFDPAPEIVDLAHRAHDIFRLDFACVDVALTREAGAVVFEVSAFGGFGGLHHGCGVDAADLLSGYVIEALQTR